ncbi:acetolactate synthase [Malassezia cuniculi]|uniref:Acetolactate synthase n=1 Tax=Malassezia cuniculi TaxID=948313 RepID=A0AAF0F1L6_9BASI|nr:acetolactate synthase [Malassezia cuniculi]
MSLSRQMPVVLRAGYALARSVPRVGSLVFQRHNSSVKGRLSSTAAFDHKLQHRPHRIQPLPPFEGPMADAGEAVSNILYNTPPPSTQPMKRHILNMFVQDEPGVLARVSGALAARGVNIDSLVVCKTDVPQLSRMCVTLRGQDGTIEQVRRQLEDLVPVWAVVDYCNMDVIERETMLVKISTLGPLFEKKLAATEAAEYDIQVAEDPSSVHDFQMATQADALVTKNSNMNSIIQLAEQFHGRVVDISTVNVIVELCAKSTRCDAFLKLVEPFGIVECARSGTMVLARTPIETDENNEAEKDVASVDASLLPPG